MSMLKSCRFVLFVSFVAHGLVPGLVSPSRSVAQEIVWQAEFDSDQVDSDLWNYDVGGHGFGNGQLEFNTARRENSYHQDGKLVLEARRENYSGRAFTSARMTTQGRFAFQYGKLEARIKVPDTANGIWPAFWMLGNNFPAINWPACGEVDILEIGGREGIATGKQHRRINCALHFAGVNEQKQSLVAWHDAPQDLHRDYHRYAVSWTPESMVFLLDDREIGRWDISGPEFREFHQPHFLLLNIAVGSFASSYTGLDTPDKITASFPARMHVDWIRLYGNEHTKVFHGAGQGESGPFGVYTETADRQLEFGDFGSPDFAYQNQAAMLLWNNIALEEAEGDAAAGEVYWSLKIDPGQWFGGGVIVTPYRNLENYSDGFLSLRVRSESAVPFRIGIKSSRGGESWLPVGDENAEFGFARDGQWHRLRIPLNRYGNIDFRTVHQLFMIAGDAPSSSVRLDLDEIVWEPSVRRPRPSGGSFGIFTENPEHKSAGEFRAEPHGFFVWEETLERGSGAALEGSQSLLLKSRGRGWCGAAFTPDVKHDLSELATAGGKLHFAIRTTTPVPFRVGMKSGNQEGVGQWWLEFRPGADPKGFARDGQWHQIEVPLSEIARDVDLTQVSQLFEYVATAGAPAEIEFDDIWISR